MSFQNSVVAENDLNMISKSVRSLKQNEKNFYFPELDGLRFIAFFLVFIHHSVFFTKIPRLTFLHSNGWIGVDLFFVLSSYLFTKLLINEYSKTNTINIRKFYIRRLFRIWPIYFLLVIFSIILTCYVRGGIIDHQFWLRILGLVTFTDNIFSAFGGYNPILFTPHLWTISYEEQFYLVIPLLILFLIRSTIKKRLLIFIFTLISLNLVRIIFIANDIPNQAIWTLPITHFDSILMGIVIGFGGYDFILKKISSINLMVLAVISFLLICLIPDLNHHSYWLVLTYNLIALSTSFLLGAVLKSDLLKKLLSNNIMVFLGKRSYGLYLFHILGNTITTFIMHSVLRISESYFLDFLLSFLITVLIATISYSFIEKPFLVLKKRYEVVKSRPI